MSSTVIIIIVLAVIISIVLLALAFGSGISGAGKNQIASLVKNQRSSEGDLANSNKIKMRLIPFIINDCI